MMEFLEADSKETESVAERAIAAYGYAAEHNFQWYLHCGGEYESSKRLGMKKEKNIFVRFGGGFGLLTKEDKGTIYSVFSEPIAPAEHRGRVLSEYAVYVLKSLSAKKVVFDIESETREKFLAVLPSDLRALPPSKAYSLVAPVVNVSAFDSKLRGKSNENPRYRRNKFFREHSLEVKNVNDAEVDVLNNIVEEWKKFRHAQGRAACERYYNLIASGFKGTERARVFVVDGRPVGFSAGWPIPNSSSYYLGVVLHDYSLPSLGVIIYLETLEWLKGSAYTHVDLGGGDKPITDFKNQFQPESWYTTYSFSVVKK